MNQPEYVLSDDTKIRTHAQLNPDRGMLVHPQHLAERKPDTEGTIRGVVGGHGGDVYWVHHENSQALAPYCFDEFEYSTEVQTDPS